jgi:hypothetical protein
MAAYSVEQIPLGSKFRVIGNASVRVYRVTGRRYIITPDNVSTALLKAGELNDMQTTYFTQVAVAEHGTIKVAVPFGTIVELVPSW